MYTSDINKGRSKKILKTVLIYLVLSVTAIVVDHVYALFGHGVRSASMSLMFLYLLLGGALGYFLLWFIAPGAYLSKWYRLGYNLYNSGIATLTVGSFYKGILDIAGTESDYTRMFSILGWGMTAAGFVVLIVSVMNCYSKPEQQRGKTI